LQHVERPPEARGWYYDGGTRLNTPVKPALGLRVDRMVVIATHSIAPRREVDRDVPIDVKCGGG